jgi:phosphatidylglycerophosphatase C
MTIRQGSVIPPLPRVDHRDLIARLEGLARDAGGQAAIALDADGTLWSGDVGFDLFKSALAERALLPAVRSALAAEAHGAGLSVADADDANAIALRLLAAWAAGDYDDGRAFQMMAWAFAGHTPAAALDLAQRALDGAGLASRVHEPVRVVVRWAQRAGVEVWIVSASPRAAVEVGARLFEVPPSRVLAVTPIVEGGLLSLELEQPVPFDVGKPRALAAAAPGALLLAAFGDSSSDGPLFLGAQVAVAVEPHERLRRLGPTMPHLVELQIRHEHPHPPAPKP